MGIRIAACGLLLVACANAGDKPATDGDASMTTGDGSGMGGARMCPAGQLAIEVNSMGHVTCAAPDGATRAAIDASCSVYLGWLDGCDGCTTPPAKWGHAGATCANVGADTTCTTPNLGTAAVPMFGLNLDGDMDGNDKLYGSLHCALPPAATSPAPCRDGEFVMRLNGTSWTCSPLAEAAVAYVRDNCSLYLGWQDNCGGCTTAPPKWGRAGSTSCQNGAGADNTCSTAVLGGETINLFGLSPDGNVDENDKLHVGLHCAAPAAASSTATTACPAGQFVTGTSADNTFRCESPAPYFHQYFTEHCSLYFGWRDSCDGCLTPPAKWGSTKVGSCTLGVGVDDTCSKFTLGQSVDVFGLSPDGDVDGNDTLYIGLRCK